MAVFFEGARRRAAVIADAAACGAVSWDSESRAGEMLQPAGYRPAGAWVRAGAGLRGAGDSIGMFCVHSRLLFDALRQAERLAGGCVSIPPWVGIAGSAFSMAVRLSDLVGSLRACAFLCGDPDGRRRDEATGNGVGGAAWARFCVNILAL